MKIFILTSLFILMITTNSLYYKFVKQYIKRPNVSTSIYDMPTKNKIFFAAVFLSDSVFVSFLVYFILKKQQ